MKRQTKYSISSWEKSHDHRSSLALVLLGYFNLPVVCWKYIMAERKQSRRFLECVEEKFLTQLVSEPTRESALLDLSFTIREGLVGDVMVGGCLWHSEHEMIVYLNIPPIIRLGVGKILGGDTSRRQLTQSNQRDIPDHMTSAQI
ncbi:rna-directed dna polymerase from mobile element jockey-like [Pitangus sulphuratus]|nr:rna-directed dna polymerase from mobile element jockey-like [Pitangus sulphuratus]